jgi:N-acetylglutamate synthase-like GNAT family acetyltransferase
MVSIRRAEPADLAVVTTLIDAAYAHYIPIIGIKPRPMLFDHAERIARGEHHVLEDDGRVEAVITLGSEGREDALHVFNIAVLPDAQGKGQLRALLAFAEAQARATGRSYLTLVTHSLMARNRAIYAHLGFEVLREQDGGGFVIIAMQRAVPAD